MKNILTIMKKELRRFFGDRRMLLSLILPGIIIFIMYTFMGSIMKNINSVDNTYTYQVYMVNEPNEYKNLDVNDKYKIEVKSIAESEIDSTKELIKNKEADLLIIYTTDFMDKVNADEVPNIEIYFNTVKSESTAIYTYYSGALSATSVKSISYNYSINNDTSKTYNLASEEDTSKMIISMLMPYLLVILLFSGSMAICTESIAGEKERGTIATLLITPTKRSHIALGKVFALSIVSLVSAASSFLGTMLSLPRIMSLSGGLTLNIYGPGHYVVMFFLMAVTVMLFTSLLSIVSAIAKSVKEASQLAIPLMMLVIVFGVLALISQGNVPSNPFLYIIPIYNLVTALTSIFALQMNLVNMIITIGSNVAYISLCIFALTRMFNSEKIMFNK